MPLPCLALRSVERLFTSASFSWLTTDARLLLNNKNRSASQPALNVNTEAPSNLVTHFSQLTVSESNREPLPAVYSKANFTPMPFHRTRGCNVRLSNDR